MKKIIAVLLTILMLFSLFQGALKENVVKADGANQWVPINNGLYGGFIRFLAVDPKNSQIIYAGTYNEGVFKSTDGEKTGIKLDYQAMVLAPLQSMHRTQILCMLQLWEVFTSQLMVVWNGIVLMQGPQQLGSQL